MSSRNELEYIIDHYDAGCGRGHGKVLVCKFEYPSHVTKKDNNLVLQILQQENLDKSVGLYLYRFKDLRDGQGFSKIGEVTGPKGIISRFSRGWHGTKKYTDTYLGKNVHKDVKNIRAERPMYFAFYEFSAENSHPKIDELHAHYLHEQSFDFCVKGEKQNRNFKLGRNLVWHEPAFFEVLNLRLPSGVSYDDADWHVMCLE